jgi:hypothetical protein
VARMTLLLINNSLCFSRKILSLKVCVAEKHCNPSAVPTAAIIYFNTIRVAIGYDTVIQMLLM